MEAHGEGPGYVLEFERAVMDGDRRRIDMCLSKDTYSSVQSAEATIKIRMARTGKRLRWYECPYCGRYHLTSKPERGIVRAA